MAFSVKLLTDVGGALLTGEGGLLGRILEKKIESMGRDLLMQHTIGAIAPLDRVFKAVSTGGMSEFERARDQFLNQFKPRPLPGLRRVGSIFSAAGRSKRRRRIRPGTWQASNWARSRDDWLDNRWRHDWRSQPRDELGRWIPGRLDYIASDLRWRGKRVGRVIKRRRKKRLFYKRAVRKALRKQVRTRRGS